MVDHFLRLKLALLVSAFRPGATLARTFGALALAAVAGVGMVWLASEVDLSLDSHRAALVIVATAIAVGIAVAPLSAGLGSAMEPRRFASFGIESRRLALALGAAAAIGVPGLLAALLGISLEIAWAGSSTAAAAVVAGVLSAIAIVIVSQYLVVVGAQLSTSISARRAVTAAARMVIVIALVSAILTVVTVQLDPDDTTLVGVAAWLANTPPGMLWAAPGSDTAALVARLLAGVVMVTVLGSRLLSATAPLNSTKKSAPSRMTFSRPCMGSVRTTSKTSGSSHSVRSNAPWVSGVRSMVNSTSR